MLRRLARADAHDAGLLQQVQRDGVDALLVDEHEVDRAALRLLQLLLEVDDALHLVVRVLALGLHQALPLLGRGVEEARVDLALLVLQAEVEREDAAVAAGRLHVRVPAAVVQHQPVDEAAVQRGLMLHGHDLHHVQVELLRLLLRLLSLLLPPADGEDGVHHDLRHVVRQLLVQLRPERRPRHVHHERAVQLRVAQLQPVRVQEAQRLLPRQLEAVHDDARVQPLCDVALGLTQQLASEQHVAGRAVARLILLCCGRARDDSGGRMLDLHLVQQHLAVLRHLDQTSARHQPDSATQPESGEDRR